MTPLRSLLTIAAAVFAVGSLAAAPLSVEQQVATLRARADRAAAAGKWNDAIQFINEARKRVRTARRVALTPRGGKISPEHERERAKLRAWVAGQENLVKAGKKSRDQVARELKSRQLALNKKYRAEQVGRVPSRTVTIRYDLLAASLDDSLSDYYSKKGNAQEAAAHRRAALVSRLHVYQAQGKQSQAAQVAEKLLAAVPSEPESYTAAASYFQERGQFQRAADTWEKGIRALQTGTATVRPTGANHDRSRTRNQYLATFYRQQAFCYAKLGRTAEAKAAIEKAARLEPTARG